MKRTLIALLVPTLFSVGLAQMDHGNMQMEMPLGSTMDLGGLEKLSGKAFDRAFLSMMVPHHQEAIDMAKAVLPKSKDAQVKKWAQAIIKDQQKEITQMNTLLKTLGGVDSKMQQAMEKGMTGMTDMVKKAKDADRAFVEGMLPHHASAISMANLALEVSDNETVLKLARDIVVVQAGEIYGFKQWLEK
ncbi:DUF305 domain-containing protein [Deinococcus cellulosilyticus]|uniref:DUF305 domain-containing protein n=1 Tax=Deinococcus cellulosilyticus (strain DSM 18568 / NBRC 106333 / KACC 11606 / 5516J-15) TaxID=1223518 RepID=A0A511N1F5_DEIC1|nr:DUF305 domain-containing protein [Deinococcus cellulosilyticus]GEM46703.1 hypothetical protein DC3_23380 [Deinococcus cellulosilyticus NBRC 106333 = KACC 11606]